VAASAAALALLAIPAGAGASVADFAMAVQPDGKVVVAGGSGRIGGAASGKEFGAVVRYDPDGHLDPSFGGGDGVVLARQLQPITDLDLQADGRILLVSSGGQLSRLRRDGGFDASFGVAGLSPPGALSAYFPTTVADLGPDGILVGGMTGYLEDPGEHLYGRLYLYPPDGLSSSWVGSMTSGDGRPGEPKTFLNDFVVGGEGEVFGAGTAAAREPTARSRAALAQLLPGPTDAGLYPTGPNPGFGAGAGLLTSDFAPADPLPEAANALSWDRGKLLLAGQAGSQLLLARYSRGGLPDPRFGRRGAVLASAGAAASASALAVTGTGRVLVAGSRAYGCGSGRCEGLLLARYKGNGKIDRMFHGGRLVRPPVASSHDSATEVAYGVAAQPEGAVLVGGLATTPGSSRFFLRRYLDDGKPDRDFGSDGRLTTLPLSAGTPPPGSGRRLLSGRG